MLECTGLADVDRLLNRISRFEASDWLAVGEHEGVQRRLAGEVATAELLARAVIVHRRLSWCEWLAADAVETLAFLVTSRASRWTRETRETRSLMALARRAAHRATVGELVQPDLTPCDYALLTSPVQSALARRYSSRR